MSELYHYGVKGMKWGVRKDPAKDVEHLKLRKARFENKAAKYGRKSAKASLKMERAKRYSPFRITLYGSRANAVDHYMHVASKYSYKQAKADKKAAAIGLKIAKKYGNIKV